MCRLSGRGWKEKESCLVAWWFNNSQPLNLLMRLLLWCIDCFPIATSYYVLAWRYFKIDWFPYISELDIVVSKQIARSPKQNRTKKKKKSTNSSSLNLNEMYGQVDRPAWSAKALILVYPACHVYVKGVWWREIAAMTTTSGLHLIEKSSWIDNSSEFKNFINPISDNSLRYLTGKMVHDGRGRRLPAWYTTQDQESINKLEIASSKETSNHYIHTFWSMVLLCILINYFTT